MLYYYQYYARDSQMGFKKFMRFCKDFEISSKISLISIEQIYRKYAHLRRDLFFDGFLNVLKEIAKEWGEGDSDINKEKVFYKFLDSEYKEKNKKKLQIPSNHIKNFSTPVSPRKSLFLKPIVKNAALSTPRAVKTKSIMLDLNTSRKGSIRAPTSPKNILKVGLSKHVDWQKNKIKHLINSKRN